MNKFHAIVNSALALGLIAWAAQPEPMREGLETDLCNPSLNEIFGLSPDENIFTTDRELVIQPGFEDLECMKGETISERTGYPEGTNIFRP